MRTSDRARAQGTRRPQSMAAIAPLSGTAGHGFMHSIGEQRCQRRCSGGTARNGEYEGVAAVVDAVAVASGEQVDVYGHSHGGIVAFGAATLAVNIRSRTPRSSHTLNRRRSPELGAIYPDAKEPPVGRPFFPSGLPHGCAPPGELASKTAGTGADVQAQLRSHLPCRRIHATRWADPLRSGPRSQ